MITLSDSLPEDPEEDNQPFNRFQRVVKGDPRQCSGSIAGERQCNLIQVPGSLYCVVHGGGRQMALNKKAATEMYQLGVWQHRQQQLVNQDDSRSLTQELALLRMLIEERTKAAKTGLDLVLISGPLSDLLTKAEKLVKSSVQLEKQLGNMLDKTQVLQLATEIMEIVGQELEDVEGKEDILESIVNRIQARLTTDG